ncbi:hypothetical protein DSF71_21065 [Salmonella enterica subsp. enterica serovar Hvittingfoss]|nr:hypothetical protein [Salmonella enterica subsp. enterica serovar Hvittingfoss]
MNKESLSWWLSLLFSGIVSYCFWLQMSQGRDQKYLFPEAIIAAMLSFTAVFGVALHMPQYSDRLRSPVFLTISILLSLVAVSCIWLTGDSSYSRS